MNVDVLIVGAGLSGLMAAATLVERGMDKQGSPPKILILDKGRSVGGRLATRRFNTKGNGAGRADHGAQFMTVRENAFQRHVEQWLADGVAYKWSDGWGPDFDGYPRYAIHNGFNALAKQLAASLAKKGVEIVTQIRVTEVSTGDESNWHVTDEAGKGYAAAQLVITSPVPQTLALLNAGNVALDPADRAALEKLIYAPCLCGLFRVEGETTFEEPGMALNPDEVVSWMADNQRKGISPDARVVTVHAGPAYSAENYDAADEEVLTVLRASLELFLGAGTEIVEEQLKRWRYAQPLEMYPERFLKASSLAPLYFGGDIFGGPKVEGAALSGMAIGKEIGKEIGKS